MVIQMAGGKKVNWDWLRPRLIEAVCAVISMYFFFMILDRLLSVMAGFNFQPYGAQVPIGFPIWGHIFDGSLAIFAVWLWMKILERAGGVKHSRLLKVITTLIIMIPFFLIPYVADSQHLIKNGLEGMIPFYVLANAAYVFLAGIVTLRVVRTRWRLVLLSGLFLAFLFLHVVLYVPMFSDFYWI